MNRIESGETPPPATGHARGAFPPFESKVEFLAALDLAINEAAANTTRFHELRQRIGLTHPGLWPDPRAKYA